MKKRVSKSPPEKPPAGQQTSQNKVTASAAPIQTPSLLQGAAWYEADREKLGRELHDSIGQPLTALKFIVDSMIKSPEKLVPLLDEMRTLISTMQKDVRNLCIDLQPTSTKSNLKKGRISKQPGGHE